MKSGINVNRLCGFPNFSILLAAFSGEFWIGSLGIPEDGEHIKPDLRARLAPLESPGLLAPGIRAVLKENNYGPALFRKHSGSHVCAQRCVRVHRRITDKSNEIELREEALQ